MKRVRLCSDLLKASTEDSLNPGFSTDESLIVVSALPHCGDVARVGQSTGQKKGGKDLMEVEGVESQPGS